MNDLKVPTKKTMDKYGADEAFWRALAEKQGFVCAICEREPPSGILCFDHEHIPMKQWRKLPGEQRRRYVRGLVCVQCNKMHLPYCITIDKARKVVAYLEAYARREVPF